jgi:hypothetical protein
MDIKRLSPQLFGAFKTEGGGHKRPQDAEFWMGWNPSENRQTWAGVQPSTYKMLDPNRDAYQIALQRMPNTLIVLRNWSFDDNNGDRWNELMANPTAAGNKIVDDWIAKCDELGVDYSRTICMLWNEPHEWEGDAAKRNLTTATLAAMRRRKKLRPQMGLLLINLGVGWPGNHDTATVHDTPPDWTPYEAVRQEMLIDKIDFLGMHEYWMKEGPRANLGWLAGRIAKCPWQVPIVIGEAAFSGAVGKPQGSVPTPLQGWAVSGLTAEQYMAQLIAYNDICRADPRIIGWQVYLCDYANREWQAKDIEPMYGLLRANLGKFAHRPQTFVWGAAPPVVPPVVPPVTPPPAPVTKLTGKIASTRPNDGVSYVYGQAPNGAMVHFAWRGNPSLAAIQAGPHAGYTDWKPGYFNIPLYSKGVTPCVGDWDIWAVFDGKTSARVQFHTDGKGGTSNQIEVNFALTTVPVTPPVVPPVVEPPVVVPAASPLRWPLDVIKVTQWFGQNPAAYAKFGLRGHNGVDFSCVVGTPVKAVADGVVAWVDDDPAGYGLYIRVWHKALGVHSFYAHLSKQQVKKGDTVTQGQVLGLSGNTGNSTGPHLHYELRPCDANGAYVDTLPVCGKACDPVGFHAGIARGAALGGGSKTFLPFVAT